MIRITFFLQQLVDKRYIETLLRLLENTHYFIYMMYDKKHNKTYWVDGIFLDKCTLCLLLILLSAGKRKPSSCLHSECLKTKTLKKQWNFHATTVRTRLNAWNEWRSTLFDSPSTQSAQPAPLEKRPFNEGFSRFALICPSLICPT